jgi:hypothetical protein
LLPTKGMNKKPESLYWWVMWSHLILCNQINLSYKRHILRLSKNNNYIYFENPSRDILFEFNSHHFDEYENFVSNSLIQMSVYSDQRKRWQFFPKRKHLLSTKLMIEISTRTSLLRASIFDFGSFCVYCS